MNNYIENLNNDYEVRANLIALKDAVREEKNRKTLADFFAGDFSVLERFLEHEDPKVRKNAALVLGAVGDDRLRDVLWMHYLKEKTLFVRGDYLKALQNLDCSDLVEELRAKLKELDETDSPLEEKKHRQQEHTALRDLIRKNEGSGKHKFTGSGNCQEIILLTNRQHREVTAKQVQEPQIRMLAGGLRFFTERLEEILPIRTYSELLFPMEHLPELWGSPEHMAEMLVGAGLPEFLRKNHRGGETFYFRLEIKSSMEPRQKAALIKKLALELEHQSKGKLMNAPGDYEVEIRLVGNRQGKYVPLIKLFTIPDRRFAYRRENLATSISPVNAALIMELCGEHFQEGAQVLDPFCGAGTMLTERAYYKSCRSMYGVDILEEAVKKARTNAEAARMTNIHYINRNFFHFTHEYLFDEIVTNLPCTGKSQNTLEIGDFYDRFLQKIPEVLAPGGIVAAYAARYAPFRESILRHGGYSICREHCLNEREGSYVVLFRQKK